MSRILYSGNRNASSWAFRAWLALKEQNIPFTEKIIDIRRPQRWKNLEEIGAFSPPAQVPVLEDDGVVIFDSLAIMEYASELGGSSLLPIDIKTRAQARALMAWQHSTFGRVCSNLFFEAAFYPDKKPLSIDEINVIERVYDIWETSIQAHKGIYLVCDYSLADIAFVPSVIRLTSHYFPDARWPGVLNWTNTLLARKHVKTWLDEAYQEDPIYLPGYRNDP